MIFQAKWLLTTNSFDSRFLWVHFIQSISSLGYVLRKWGPLAGMRTPRLIRNPRSFKFFWLLSKYNPHMHIASHDLLQLGVGILTSQGNDLSTYFHTAPLYQLGFERVLDQKNSVSNSTHLKRKRVIIQKTLGWSRFETMGWGPLSRVSVYFAGHMPETVIWTSIKMMGCDECP